MILDRSVNKMLKKELRKLKKSKENSEKAEIPKKTSVNAILKLKEKGFRIKVAEIAINADGILATCFPYKDLDTIEKINDQPIVVLSPETKSPFPLNNELSRIYSLINIIKTYLNYDKISSFESSSFLFDRKEDLSPEKTDELLIKIIAEFDRIGRYLKDDTPLTSQIFLESRSLILRVLFIRRKLEKIWESLEIVNRNFKLVEDNLRKLEMLNKARMCLDLINYSSEKKLKEADPQMSSPLQPNWKKYMDKLSLIEDPASKERIRKEIERFQQLDRTSGEYHKINTYLDEVFSIPWQKFSEPYWNVKSTSRILEKNIYGLDKVKERILEMVAVNKLKLSDKKAKGFVILLHGPPGTGKTSIAKNIAAALRRNVRLISFSGVTDSYFIKGHRRTYVDSQPGVFIKEIIKAGVMNPVLILDEIDKLSQTRQGSDPYNALLEILNPEENMNFVDHYLDIKVDFSNVIFILTANEIVHILEPLKNRLEIIAIPGYIEEEKLSIAQNYLLPQVLSEAGVEKNWLNFNDNVLVQIIKGWCFYENGVRELKRSLEKITRKYVAEIMEKVPETEQDEAALLKEMKEEIDKNTEKKPIIEEKTANFHNRDLKPILAILSNSPIIDHSNKENLKENLDKIEPMDMKFEIKTPETQILHPTYRSFSLLANPIDFSTKNDAEIYEFLRRYLGPPDSDYQLEERSHKVFPPGILNILSVANQIGQVLKVECIFDKSKPDKKGEFTSSGNLKSVVQESIQIAKINAYRFLSSEQIKDVSERNVHIHFMSGAQPKDGPSAGIAFCTAFLSLILNKPVPANWSMTGELTLKGEIARIGGVNSKIIASKSFNIANIIMPFANYEEVCDLPKRLLEGLTIYFVKEYKDVYELMFGDAKNVMFIKNGDMGERVKTAEVSV